MDDRDQPGKVVVVLGDLIKSARLRNRLTLKELAEDPEIGVSATFLSRVERNDALPSDELLLKLAQKLDIDATSALLHLFRERASPEVREFVPDPSVLKLRHATPEVEDLSGLERLAEPISQVLDIHRSVLEENERLRSENTLLSDEINELSAEIGETNREVLPDVNRFLISLFNYETEVFRRETVVSRNGDATITVTQEGITPKKGARPIRTLDHSVYIPQAFDGSLNIAGQPAKFEVLECPKGLKVEHAFKRESTERGSFVVNFPDGFAWSPGDGRLSYSFSYRLEKAFTMTYEEAKAVYGRRTVHDSPLEWSSCFITKPVKRLETSVCFPAGYAPGYVDRWVWWTGKSFLETEHSLADRLLVDPEDGIEIEQDEIMTVRLRAKNPLLGFSYGVVWQPLWKRNFLELIQD